MEHNKHLRDLQLFNVWSISAIKTEPVDCLSQTPKRCTIYYEKTIGSYCTQDISFEIH